MNYADYISICLSVAALAVALFKRRKPTLAAAVARGVAYGEQMGKTHDEKRRHAIGAVIREDEGDNGKRDWSDAQIRIAVEALLFKSK